MFYEIYDLNVSNRLICLIIYIIKYLKNELQSQNGWKALLCNNYFYFYNDLQSKYLEILIYSINAMKIKQGSFFWNIILYLLFDIVFLSIT